jgi:hypothetical protein
MNKNLHNAKNSKNDEFYTQYTDIQKEVDAYLEYNPNVFKDKTILLPCDDPEWSNFTNFFVQNFEKFGLKKLISTCYTNTKNNCQTNLFENYDCSQNFNSHGKFLIVTKDNLNSKWQYLKGDGDFRSSEIKALRDESDFIITNPPFSLFREFVSWIFETDKKFLIIGNMNAIKYKKVFPLIKDNKMWLGKGFKSMVGHFINKFYTDYATASDHKEGMIRVPGVVWFTNLEHGIKHKPLLLLTMNDNLRFNKKLKNPKYQYAYKKYDNYDAIEIPLTEAIPSDYDGVMGVPITFLDKYCPEQFEIIDISSKLAKPIYVNGKRGSGFYINGKRLYDRIVIRKIK